MDSKIDLRIKKWFCILIWLVFTLFSVSISFGNDKDQNTFKKQNWIKANGSTVWVGLKFERKKMIGCRLNDNSVLTYKPWGLSKKYSTQQIVPCPDFFYQVPAKEVNPNQ